MQSNSFATLSLQQLKQAVAIREKIDSLEMELSRIIGGQLSPAKSGVPTAKRTRRKMSAAARAKFSAAAKARWANFRAKKGKKYTRPAMSNRVPNPDFDHISSA
jgi:hypothetical protein